MRWNARTGNSTDIARRMEAAFSAAAPLPDRRTVERRSTSTGLAEWGGRIASSTAPSSILLVRAVVGAVFLLEGNLKFLDPEGLGVGRFTKIGIPFPSLSAPFVGVFEIVCGIGLMLGLLTRWGAVPMIVNMIVAITSTKIPLLLHEGFWKAAHEARLDVTMLLSCLFLLLVGAGPLSLDHLLLAPSRDDRGGTGTSKDTGWRVR